MRNLKSNENAVYQSILRVAAEFQVNECSLVAHLIQVERLGFYRKLGRATLVEFIQKEIKIDSEQTFVLDRVTKIALIYPELAEALESGQLHFSQATRIISKIDKTNASDLVQFASTHTFAEVRRHVADMNVNVTTRETMKRIAKNQTRISLVIDDTTLELLARAQALQAQRGKPAKMCDALKTMAQEFVDKRDPVARAERALKRKINIVHTSKSSKPNTKRRLPLTAAQTNEVMAKTKGRCTFTSHEGRCGKDRHIHI